ncbi:MAG: DNA mismatch repair protein MutS, partial [Clostridia bacterium]|nr:DNA mismatch repair protein MutS [Clostridia bacterium]
MPYTPMMLQYFEVKDQYKDHILFYRLGDFYEMFFDDAITASRELELTLTGRDCGMEERAPMCGVPYHSAEGYIAKLVGRGYKVAICEQVEDPATAKGIVKRDVVRIITPGTVTEGSLLLEGKNNYLCAMFIEGSRAGFAVADISTADVYATDFSQGDIISSLTGELAVYSPSEVITNINEDSLDELAGYIRGRLGAYLGAGDAERFSKGLDILVKQFGEDYLNQYGISPESPALVALSALFDYLTETQKQDISNINKLTYYNNEQFLAIDVNTRRNLELCEAMRTREKKGTLLWVLDRTKTAMGSRLLRKWVEQPLVSVNMINTRQEAVKELFGSFIAREELQLELSGINDIERLLTKIVYGTANGRDLNALMVTCEHIPRIRELLASFNCPELCELYTNIDELSDIKEEIKSAICDTPPFSIREGGFIRDGYNTQIDELRSIMGEGRSWIAKIEAEEKEATGIKNLK